MLPQRVPLTIQFRLFHVTFFLPTFNLEKLRKIYRQLAPLERTPKMSNIAKFWKWLLKTDEDISPQSREILQRFVWLGPAQTYFLPPPPSLPHHVQRSVDFHNFAELYISARLRRIAFKFGNFTATEIKLKLNSLNQFKRCMKTTRKLSVSARYVREVQKYLLPLLLWRYWDDCSHKKKYNNNKIEQEQEVNSFLTAMNPQTSSYFPSS